MKEKEFEKEKTEKAVSEEKETKEAAASEAIPNLLLSEGLSC